MKKTLLIALLLIPFLGISQTTKPIEGFLGIKFGASREEVIAALKAKGGTLINNPSDQILNFRGLQLGPRNAAQVDVDFVNNKAYEGFFYFKPEHDPETIEYYNALVNDISDIYGKTKPYKSFKSPYKDGDGDEIAALTGGYATYFTDWLSGDKMIQASIKPIKDDLYVTLGYYDKTLQSEAQANEKAKAKADY